MKLFKKPALISVIITGLCIFLFSFSGKRGGDSFQIYVDGKLVVEQYVSIAKGVQSLQLGQLSSKEKIEVYYSHCGKIGKSRVISIKSADNKTLKVLKFADTEKKSFMTCQIKEILALQKNKSAKLNLYYSSKELPEGRLLAVINSAETKTASVTR
ncbi:MAG: hypothetical protein ACXWV9_03250 [Flavisolibacter sp.]